MQCCDSVAQLVGLRRRLVRCSGLAPAQLLVSNEALADLRRFSARHGHVDEGCAIVVCAICVAVFVPAHICSCFVGLRPELAALGSWLPAGVRLWCQSRLTSGFSPSSAFGRLHICHEALGESSLRNGQPRMRGSAVRQRSVGGAESSLLRSRRSIELLVETSMRSLEARSQASWAHSARKLHASPYIPRRDRIKARVGKRAVAAYKGGACARCARWRARCARGARSP